jgi:anthranilate phosphoribosyltransferase
VLTGERDDHFADAVALNAAVRIYAGGGAETRDEGLSQARKALATGEPADRLAALREF